MSAAARRAPEPPIALWLATSLLLHAAVALALFRGGGAWRARVGERGSAGAGGERDAVEVTFVAEPAARPEARTEETAIEPTARPTSPVAASPREVAAPRPRVETEDSSAPSLAREGVEASASPMQGEAPTEAGPSASTDGTSNDGSPGAEARPGIETRAAAALILGSAGRLEGESVRASAILGESLSCEDPIEGTWVAYRYSPEFRDWARFTLRIEREDRELRGSIVARMWRGLPSERRPPACRADGWDYTVTMRATGNLTGDQMAFGASTHEITRIDCPSSFFSYNPDHFTGRVEPLADRMHTVNNDGGRDVDAPYEFRRTRCGPSRP